MPFIKLHFGSHIGNTVPQIAFNRPGYIAWAVGNLDNLSPELKAQFWDVYSKMQRIRIPAHLHPPGSQIEYIVHPTGKLEGATVIPPDYPKAAIHHRSLVFGHFDLLAAEMLATRDQLGERRLLKAFKEIILGNGKARMTKQKAEAFFANGDNFVVYGPGRAEV